MPGPQDGTLLSPRSRQPNVPRGCHGRGHNRGGRPRPAWDPCRRKQPSEHLGRCLLPRKVCYAAGELVEVEPSLRANGRFQQGTDLPDLELQLAEQLCRPALGADHVPEDRALRPPGDEWLGQTVDVDERAATASTVLFYRDEGHDVVGPYVFSEPEGDDTVRYNLHLDTISILQTLITSSPAPGDPSRRKDHHRLLDDAIRTLSRGRECVSERVRRQTGAVPVALRSIVGPVRDIPAFFRQRSPVEDPYVRILCAGIYNGAIPVPHVLLRVGSAIEQRLHGDPQHRLVAHHPHHTPDPGLQSHHRTNVDVSRVVAAERDHPASLEAIGLQITGYRKAAGLLLR